VSTEAARDASRVPGATAREFTLDGPTSEPMRRSSRRGRVLSRGPSTRRMKCYLRTVGGRSATGLGVTFRAPGVRGCGGRAGRRRAPGRARAARRVPRPGAGELRDVVDVAIAGVADVAAVRGFFRPSARSRYKLDLEIPSVALITAGELVLSFASECSNARRNHRPARNYPRVGVVPIPVEIEVAVQQTPRGSVMRSRGSLCQRVAQLHASRPRGREHSSLRSRLSRQPGRQRQ
jgi:hypothetical protein